MTKPKPTFPVSETTLVFAFRYALGRQTTAPSHMVEQLTRHWAGLQGWTREQIRGDIQRAIDNGTAGAPCDVDTWRAILELRVGDTCPECGRAWHVCLCTYED